MDVLNGAERVGAPAAASVTNLKEVHLGTAQEDDGAGEGVRAERELDEVSFGVEEEGFGAAESLDPALHAFEAGEAGLDQRQVCAIPARSRDKRTGRPGPGSLGAVPCHIRTRRKRGGARPEGVWTGGSLLSACGCRRGNSPAPGACTGRQSAALA